jgi:hypothetical protein
VLLGQNLYGEIRSELDTGGKELEIVRTERGILMSELLTDRTELGGVGTKLCTVS